jgi:hypothetical protein
LLMFCASPGHRALVAARLGESRFRLYRPRSRDRALPIRRELGSRTMAFKLSLRRHPVHGGEAARTVTRCRAPSAPSAASCGPIRIRRTISSSPQRAIASLPTGRAVTDPQRGFLGTPSWPRIAISAIGSNHTIRSPAVFDVRWAILNADKGGAGNLSAGFAVRYREDTHLPVLR